MKKLILIVGLFALSLNLLAGGGWVYKQSKGFFKVGQNVIRSPYFFDSNGEIIDIPTTSLYTTSCYGEYGLTNNLNVLLYAPLFVRATQNKEVFRQSGLSNEGYELNTSIGDTNLGLKYGWNQNGAIVWAGSVTLGLPFGQSKPEGSLQTGDGEFNQLFMLEASHSFYPKPFYSTLFVGFNNRTKGFSEEVRVGGEVGLTVGDFIAILKVNSVNSLNNGDVANNAEGATLNGNNVEYLAITPEVAYSFSTSTGISASVGFASSGRNQLASPNFSLGFFMNL
ncbi:MAG: hypothetical protein RJQ14_26810 [Marinoscillum sp.]